MKFRGRVPENYVEFFQLQLRNWRYSLWVILDSKQKYKSDNSPVDLDNVSLRSSIRVWNFTIFKSIPNTSARWNYFRQNINLVFGFNVIKFFRILNTENTRCKLILAEENSSHRNNGNFSYQPLVTSLLKVNVGCFPTLPKFYKYKF